MITVLWVSQIILGKRVYAKVPRQLKEKVKEMLIEAGYEEKIVE